MESTTDLALQNLSTPADYVQIAAMGSLDARPYFCAQISK
jgi:hypothetical protein